MKIIKQSQIVEEVTREHSFENADCPGSGYGFVVDKNGKPTNTNEHSQANYAKCIAGVGIIDQGIIERTHRYTDPAVGKCSCGKKVYLDDPLDNTCDGCGRTYNSSGQEVTHSSDCDSYGEPRWVDDW